MRKRIMLFAALVAILAAGLTVVTQGAAETSGAILPRGCSHLTTAQAFQPFSAKVWDQHRWRRKPHGEPGQRAIDAKQERVHCARSKHHAKVMEKVWSADRADFMDVRGDRIRAKQARDSKEALIAEYAGTLAAIRACESGGDYSIDTGNGFYGAYQFTISTWESVGGYGLPSDASKFEQDYRAALLLSTAGNSPWPVCG